jgi:hypothetical protein
MPVPLLRARKNKNPFTLLYRRRKWQDFYPEKGGSIPEGSPTFLGRFFRQRREWVLTGRIASQIEWTY